MGCGVVCPEISLAYIKNHQGILLCLDDLY